MKRIFKNFGKTNDTLGSKAAGRTTTQPSDSGIFANAQNVLISGGTFTIVNGFRVNTTIEGQMGVPVLPRPNPSPIFTGRKDVLDKLGEIFVRRGDDRLISRRSCLLWGMKGIGKTQICLKFIEEMFDSFSYVFWVDASSQESITMFFKGLSAAQDSGMDGSVASALLWISRIQEEWLMVFDNADDPLPETVAKFIPPGNSGNIIITSRNRSMGSIAFENIIEINEMEEPDAVALLLKASCLDASPEHLQAARRIVSELGRIPLAVDHAGAYIQAGKCGIDEYLRQFSFPSAAPKPPPLVPRDSTDPLVRSAFERKVNEQDSIKVKADTTERLEDMRRLMIKDKLDYYIVPSEDAHQSEWVAASDKRREFMCGFTGLAGQAIVTMQSAYLLSDSRYWLQSQKEIDENWILVKVGSPEEPQDWVEWIVNRAEYSRIGIDARMISHEKATLLNSKLSSMGSILIFPPQNLVDLIWKAKPAKPGAAIYIPSVEFAGRDANRKLSELREWIRRQPSSAHIKALEPNYPYAQVATLVTSLTCIAYILNLRGSDIPYNSLFHSYLFVGLDSALLFVETSKVQADVATYLQDINVQLRPYTDIWPFLRRKEWGEGKVLIAPQTSYAISLMLTHFRFTLTPPYIEHMMSVKNETEIDGMRKAYLRDGVSFVKFLAWLETKLAQGYEITEYEAACRLTEYRRGNEHLMGLPYINVSGSGSNSALPHYSPRKSTGYIISRDTPYLNDSGAHYYDGTCNTTRTLHFGRPTPEMSEAYTRVLQGHIAIDTAIFPEGTSGHQLDVLARKALWKDGYMHGTGHGFGAFLNVHAGPRSFSSNIPLVPGHVITNEPGFYLDGKWGMRVESALAVRKVKGRGEFSGDIWLGLERLTCVPIQLRMVKESMLTKEEKTWLKDHNQRCYDRISPFLQEDKRALAWLKKGA